MAGFNKKHTSLVLLGFLQSRPPCMPLDRAPDSLVAPWMGTESQYIVY
jgi:hypothetical protein